jgi:hypothetical protein
VDPIFERHRFGLANPKLFGEREQARLMLERQPVNRPAPGTAIVTDKGLPGEETEAFFAAPDLGLELIRPARKDEKEPRCFPNWLRQKVEAIIWTLKHQLGLECHGSRVPAGLWARIVQRLLALNACIWHTWQIGAPVKRSLIAYDHANARTCGHVGGPPPPTAPKFRFASEPAVPLRSGWSGHCLQVVERVLTTLRLRKTQDKCQSLRDRGALADRMDRVASGRLVPALRAELERRPVGTPPHAGS